MLVSRQQVYEAIDSERAYQDAGSGNAQRHPDYGGHAPGQLLPGEVILCMRKCLRDAEDAWYRPDGVPDALNYIRKVAALAVQCMENYGAPHRVVT